MNGSSNQKIYVNYKSVNATDIKSEQSYTFQPADKYLAVSVFVLGFIFWEWAVAAWQIAPPGIGVTLFFVLAIIITLIYFRVKRIMQNKRSGIALVVLICGILPFLLFDSLPIYSLLLIFDLLVSVIWIMLSCETAVSNHINPKLVGDTINQAFIVPFANFIGVFRALINKNQKGKRHTSLIVLISLVCFIPVFVLIFNLLISADSGFAEFARRLTLDINLGVVFRWIVELVAGIPVAMYIFGSLYGNSTKRRTDIITEQKMESAYSSLRRLPKAAMYAPLIVLLVMYTIFVSVVASYLFGAMTGHFAAGFSYAEYARSGFFELCAISVLNLIILIAVYLFCRREIHEYPKAIRVLTGLLSVLTVLLCVTAGSKMLLYIDQYGLTRLRLYTLLFMILLFISFALIVSWHIKPYNVFRPIFFASVIMILVLFLGNTDGVIASYNVNEFEKGQIAEMDVEQYRYMSDAVIPALCDLKQSEKMNASLATEIDSIISEHRVNSRSSVTSSYNSNAFPAWNLQSELVWNSY